MSVQRWDPFAEMMSLREAMNRLFEESFVRPGSAMQPAGGPMGLSIDLRENEDNYVLEAAVPGLKPDDIDISVLGNQVTLQGETKQEQDRQGERYHLRERRFGRFQRTVSLPTAVQADQATAEFRDGMLILTLPKAQETRPRRIPIGRGGQQQIETTAQAGASQPPVGGAAQSGGGQPPMGVAQGDQDQPPAGGADQGAPAQPPLGGTAQADQPEGSGSTQPAATTRRRSSKRGTSQTTG